MEEIYEKLKLITDEKNILVNEPMSKHTTFRTGGNADFFVTPENIEELEKILKVSGNVIVIGNGSNLLVTDKGIRGVVVSLKKLNNFEIKPLSFSKNFVNVYTFIFLSKSVWSILL